MALLQDSHKELKLPTRPLVLGRLASQPCLFAESTRMPRRGSSAPNSGARSDEWRNSGGKNAVVSFAVPPELVFDDRGAGLYLSR